MYSNAPRIPIEARKMSQNSDQSLSHGPTSSQDSPRLLACRVRPDDAVHPAPWGRATSSWALSHHYFGKNAVEMDGDFPPGRRCR